MLTEIATTAITVPFGAILVHMILAYGGSHTQKMADFRKEQRLLFSRRGV